MFRVVAFFFFFVVCEAVCVLPRGYYIQLRAYSVASPLFHWKKTGRRRDEEERKKSRVYAVMYSDGRGDGITTEEGNKTRR